MLPLLLAVAAVAPAAPVPRELRQTDNSRLVGTWEMTAATFDNDNYPSGVGTKWTLDADGGAVRDRPNLGVSTAKYTLDPVNKTFVWNTVEGYEFRGVYELTGTSFRVTMAQMEATIPTKVGPAPSAYCFEFKRVEKPK